MRVAEPTIAADPDNPDHVAVAAMVERLDRDSVRRRGALDAPEEVYLDVDDLAAGHDCFLLGAVEASRDARLVAYALRSVREIS